MQKSATVALISNNKILLLQRGDTAPWNPNKYCLPGGKLDDNESLICCAIRELKEETDIDLSLSQLKPLTINYPKYSKVVFFCIDNKNHNIKLNWEHSKYLWTSIRESFLVPIVPGLRTTIDTLIQYNLLQE